jgi:hypothetical protein
MFLASYPLRLYTKQKLSDWVFGLNIQLTLLLLLLLCRYLLFPVVVQYHKHI